MLSQLAHRLHLESDTIQVRRNQVAERVMRESNAIRDINFDTINTRDLFELFANYDELFFEGELARVFEASNHTLDFRLSSRMTSTGGMTTYYRSRSGSNRIRSGKPVRKFEIAVSTTLLFNTGFKQSHGVLVGGLPTVSRLDALQRIFEHELIHLLEMIVWDDSSCAQARFKSIVSRFFGHLESNHQLLTPSDTARAEFGITAGDTVSFLHKGARLVGVVNGINRRATVLVRQQQRKEQNRSRSNKSESSRQARQVANPEFQRYYVPLSRLKKIGA